MTSEKILSKKSTAKLKERESSSCIVKIQKSWGIFMRKLFHVNSGGDRESQVPFRSTDEIPRSSKTTAVSSQKTDTCFKAQTFSSSISLVERDGEFPPHLSELELLELLEVEHEDKHKHDREVTFLDLPFQVRRRIYSLIDPKDILSLRLTMKALKNDAETKHGVIVRLHDGRLDYEKPLQILGIVKLIVEQFIQEDKSILRTYIPFPHLLKTIMLTGPISRTSLRYLLSISENLNHLIVSFQSPHEQNFKMKRSVLKQLKILEIVSDSFRSESENYLVATSVWDLFANLKCKNLSCLVFNIVGASHEKIDDFHELAMSFIMKYKKSLRKINIKLMKIMSPSTALMNTVGNDIPFQFAEWMGENNPMTLREITLIMNTGMEQWYPMIYAQSDLHTLKLDARGHHWNRLDIVLNKCGKTLRSLSVLGLVPSNINNGTVTPDPVDIALLENVEGLESLEIRHEETESRGMIPASLIQTNLFPPTLKSVKLAHFRLKPYQAMFLFLKLPRVEQLVLDFWVDSEATLSGFLAVITFLIKFDQTPARRIEMTDYRRKMENQQDSILRMKNVLQNHANIRQRDSELYSTLTIEK